MTLGGTVNFMHIWERPASSPEGDYEDVVLDVSAKMTAFYPMVGSSLSDPGCPAEGGEVEDVVVLFEDGTVLDPIPEDLLEDLLLRAHEEHHDNG